MPFETLQTDSGKEFSNNIFGNWARSIGIVHKTTTPYYHAANGRIERANRTIRQALNRMNGSLKVKLNRALQSYNATFHRGINTTPTEACEPENFNKVLTHTEKYAKEFKERQPQTFRVGDKVIIKNETKINKNDDEFKIRGKISEILEHNSYSVKLKDGKTLKRHASHLRIWPGDVDYQ